MDYEKQDSIRFFRGQRDGRVSDSDFELLMTDAGTREGLEERLQWAIGFVLNFSDYLKDNNLDDSQIQKDIKFFLEAEGRAGNKAFIDEYFARETGDLPFRGELTSWVE